MNKPSQTNTSTPSQELSRRTFLLGTSATALCFVPGWHRRLRPRALLLSLLFLAVTVAPAAWAETAYQRTEDVIYGRKFGTALTLDVFRPDKPNGYGIVLIVSGGFFSSHDAINAKFMMPLLDRGYTVFAVVHGSQPRFIIPEIMQDIHRAVRFIRLHASDYAVDPDKLGVSGGSAGGHLSLILATQGGPGKTDAKDPVDRASSAVQAVACFFPPTDFLNWGEPGEDAVGVGRLKGFKPAFGPRSDTVESRQVLGREISPIQFVHSNMPPILIVHGDADRLVPLYQANTFAERVQALGGTVQVDVRQGKEHGWPDMSKDLSLFADWFDQHLRGLQKKSELRTPPESRPKERVSRIHARI